MQDSAHHPFPDDLSDLLGLDSGPPEPVEPSPGNRAAPAPEIGSAGRISAAALADLLDITSRSVREITGNGILRTVARGQYDLRESVRAYCAWVRAARKGTVESVTEAKLRKELAAAEKLELQNAITRGDFVSASDVADTWFGIMRDVRSGVLAIPGRIQAQNPSLSKSDIEAIDLEIRAALTEIADD